MKSIAILALVFCVVVISTGSARAYEITVNDGDGFTLGYLQDFTKGGGWKDSTTGGGLTFYNTALKVFVPVDRTAHISVLKDRVWFSGPKCSGVAFMPVDAISLDIQSSLLRFLKDSIVNVKAGPTVGLGTALGYQSCTEVVNPNLFQLPIPGPGPGLPFGSYTNDMVVCLPLSECTPPPTSGPISQVVLDRVSDEALTDFLHYDPQAGFHQPFPNYGGASAPY
jgi:hypothetical protein